MRHTGRPRVAVSVSILAVCSTFVQWTSTVSGAFHAGSRHFLSSRALSTRVNVLVEERIPELTVGIVPLQFGLERRQFFILRLQLLGREREQFGPMRTRVEGRETCLNLRQQRLNSHPFRLPREVNR